MDKYGDWDMIKHVADDFITISSIRSVKEMTLAVLSYPDKTTRLIVSDKDAFRIFPCLPADKSVLVNNLTPVVNPLWLYTLVAGESEDSFLFLLMSEDDPDSNPQILEVYQCDLPK